MDDSRELVVLEVRQETPLIRSLYLGDSDRGPLVGFAPGDHVKVWLPIVPDERHYSLINTDPSADTTAAPTRYHIAVRLDDGGRGGSQAMHGLQPGDWLRVSAPIHGFPLEPRSGPLLLLAGGIGVTPLLSMAAALRGQGKPFWVRYCGRSRDQLAFADALQSLAGPENFAVHCDDEAGCVLDVPGLFDELAPDAMIYVCGPAPMIEAVIAESARRDLDRDRVRFELFQAAAPKSGDQAFEVELRKSGKIFTIPPGQSILDVLLAAGEDPLHDCKRGDCGICQVEVLEGEVDHRDFVLSEAERAANNVMQVCVSRAKTPRLVLDL
jgi:ferredoxin-NADP reductase